MDIKPAPTMPGQAEENWNTVNAYCIQCLTGYESKTADAIRLCCDGVDAYAVMQERHRSRAGRRTLERSVMLPGYVFVYAREALSFRRLLSVENVIRFLSYGGQDGYHLKDSDLAFSRWVWRHRGFFICSRAAKAGDHLRIIEGPLADRIGTVLKIDRHNRNVCISISFDGNERKVWLPFVWTADSDPTAAFGGVQI